MRTRSNKETLFILLVLFLLNLQEVYIYYTHKVYFFHPALSSLLFWISSLALISTAALFIVTFFEEG